MTDAEVRDAFDEHKNAVYRLAWRLCGSAAAAEDITQDVFVARLEALDGDAAVVEPIDIERGEVGEIVGRAVRALPALQREVVILFEYEDLTLAEIAQVVDANVGTVKSRLQEGTGRAFRLASPRTRRSPLSWLWTGTIRVPVPAALGALILACPYHPAAWPSLR